MANVYTFNLAVVTSVETEGFVNFNFPRYYFSKFAAITLSR
jgi:hypothetical protein